MKQYVLIVAREGDRADAERFAEAAIRRTMGADGDRWRDSVIGCLARDGADLDLPGSEEAAEGVYVRECVSCSGRWAVLWLDGVPLRRCASVEEASTVVAETIGR